MKKSDLKDGMVVETRENELFVVHDGYIKCLHSYCPIDSYNDNLFQKNFSCLDIMKVYSTEKAKTITDMLTKKYLTLIWERKEYPKLTRFEKEFLKRIFIDYCQITRDPGGELFAYTDGHVIKGKCGWNISNDGEAHYLCTLRDDFSFIKWEDTEPWNIQDLLENCEVENERDTF